MPKRFLKIHPSDNVYVALTDLRAGETLAANNKSIVLADDTLRNTNSQKTFSMLMMKSTCMALSLAKQLKLLKLAE